MNKLKDKVYTAPDGKRYYFLTGKDIGDGKRSIYLLNLVDEGKPIDETSVNYSLWYVENTDDAKIDMWPYEGADSKDLIKELLRKYVNTAYDEE